MSSSPEPRAPWGLRLWESGSALLVFAGYALWMPPWAPHTPSYGGPDSWREVLCHFTDSGLRVGTDLVYTTGPLGVLRQPLFCAPMQGIALAWGLLLALCMAVIFARLFRGSGTAVRLCGMVVLLAMPVLDVTAGTGIYYSLLVGSLFLEARRSRPGLRWADLPLALALAVGGWILFTHLVLTALMVAVGAAIYGLRFRRPSPLAALYLGSAAVVWVGTGQGISNLVPYLRTSVEISSGYPDVMARYGPAWEMGLPFLAFAAFAAVFLGSQRGRLTGVRGVLLLALSGFFLMVFKTGFVRHERPRISTVVIIVVAMALFHLAQLSRQGRAGGPSLDLRRWAGAATVAVMLLAIGVDLLMIGRSAWDFPAQLVKFPIYWQLRVDGLRRHLRGEDLFERRARESAAKVRETLDVPPLAEPVDWFGVEAGKLVAAGIEYRPRPVFQSYVAYTPALAELNAEFYRSPDAPPTVLVGLRSIARYPPTLLDGRAVLELLASYRPAQRPRVGVGADSRATAAIFERRQRRPCELDLVKEIGPVPEGQGVDFEEWTHRVLWAEFEVRLTPAGQIASWLTKPSVLWLRLWTEEGKRKNARFAAKPAAGGFLLSPLLRDADDLVELARRGVQGRLADRKVSALKLEEGPHWGPAHRASYSIKLYALHGCLEEAGQPSPKSNRIQSPPDEP